MTEYEIHCRVVAMLRAAGWGDCMFHCPNESKAPVQYRVKLKSLGVSPGVPDLIIMAPPSIPMYAGSGARALFDTKRPGAALEIKAEKGRPTKAQLAWLDRFQKAGFLVDVGRGLSECVRILTGWGYLTPRT